MKKLFMTVTACLLALMITALSPLMVFAKAPAGTSGSDGEQAKGKYISEVKIGMGKDAAEAAAALKGYKILSDKSGSIDLNQKAGGGFASKGENVVYLGYKTTDDDKEAITDLAVMNMKGGYDTAEYDVLFEKYLSEQIEPLVNNLTSALEEYRANFSSSNESNRNRAAYIHNALNKFIDDDTGKGLGDLLLNRTEYEIGDEAYDALSEAQKQNTADIVTILAQANGQATLMLENLLARAADTSDDTWIDRFSAVSYDDMLDEVCDETGMLPTDAEKELDRLYQDDARKILVSWNDLYGLLADYEKSAELIDTFDFDAAEQRLAELEEFISGFDENENTQEELFRAIAEQTELSAQLDELMNAIKIAGAHDYLEEIEYGSGTLLDFFARPSRDVDITELYPVSASFSDGQKAGLDFISLLELVTIAITDGADYSDESLDELEEASIYEGVDREIYKKGGVGLTTAARRRDAALRGSENIDMFSPLTITSMGVTSAAFIAFGAADICRRYFNARIPSLNYEMGQIRFDLDENLLIDDNNLLKLSGNGTYEFTDEYLNALENGSLNVTKEKANELLASYNKLHAGKAIARSRAAMCKYLEIGLGVAIVLLTIYTVYATYTDMKAYYNVEFTPIPRYMVDEKDIVSYNEKGEKIFVKNQTAYYKAVECNRTPADEMFGTLGVCSDLNGDVGKQWLALYSVKNEAMAPILSDSLMAVVNDDRLPAAYTTGIHMFGSDTAFNLNDHSYVWEGEAPSVYVYFNVDSAAKRSAIGSIFADSATAFAGGIGIIIGALAACAVMLAIRKKKEREAVVTD